MATTFLAVRTKRRRPTLTKKLHARSSAFDLSLFKSAHRSINSLISATPFFGRYGAMLSTSATSPGSSPQQHHTQQQQPKPPYTRRNRTSRHSYLVVTLMCASAVLVCVWGSSLVYTVWTVELSGRGDRSLLRQFQAWQNDRNIVHVVQTRFMQFQPNLLALGQARLDLFAALTVPSMQHQTLQQFLWIIRTDPALDETLQRQLIRIVSAVPNAVLVASNLNPEGFRDDICVEDMTVDTVLAGDLRLVQAYHAAAATHNLLETRLDADDAVATDFVELIQTTSAVHLTEDWICYCAQHHMEWQYSSPWHVDENDNDVDTGALLGVQAGHCITPGLTWGYAVGAHRSALPSHTHQRIHKEVQECPLDYETDESGESSSQPKSKCLVKLGGDLPLALRARTPTSAGMDHIYITEHTEDQFPMERLRQSRWRFRQDDLWNSLPTLFGVQKTDLWTVRNSLGQHLPEIVRDALKGQCTKGHSCKEGTKTVLAELVDSTAGQNSTR